MPGQNGEDRIIADYLNTLAGGYPRRFLDVGAYDPAVFSNTQVLASAGWSGVYVEPAPGNFNRFLAAYSDNPRIMLVNAAVDAASSLLEFWDCGGDAVSSSVPEHVAKWSVGHIKFRKFFTKSITWKELLDAMDVEHDPISVLSLDVESMNLKLFTLLPLERLLPSLRVFVVEHDGHKDKMSEILRPHGFTSHHVNPENVIYVR